MSLTKKVVSVVLGLFIIVFVVTYLITINNSRQFFIEQMNSNAQDTATSLGLSLSNALQEKDKALMLPMVEAVFDRGYFSMIEVRDMRGKLLVSRYAPRRQSIAPEWFIEWTQWPSSVQSSLVMNGWNQVGEVLVTSDSSYASDALWSYARSLVYLYLVFAGIALIVTVLFLRWLLRPLKRVTKQAEAICQREFPVETTIPKTTELKHLTLAMNQMVNHIKMLFQEQMQQMEVLRHQAFQDGLTNLGNHRYFHQQLSVLLGNEEEFTPGFVVLINIEGLEQVNQKQGFQQGDQVLLTVARLCSNFWSRLSNVSLARISGSNFALIVKEISLGRFLNQCEEFNSGLQQALKFYPECQGFVAATSYYLHQTVKALLEEADQILLQARTKENLFAYSASIRENELISLDKDAIGAALENGSFNVYLQEVTDGENVFHNELFLRIKINNIEVRGGRFLPIVDNSEMAAEIDTAVLKKLIDSQLLRDKPVALNLTAFTVIDPQARNKYLKLLEAIPAAEKNNIHLEFNETVVLNHFVEAIHFTKAVQKLGIHLGVDQVGIHFSPMHYLNQLPLDYLKVHGSLFHDIDENQTRQFFFYYFNEMAKTLNIQVVATQIETEKQWETLKSLKLRWGQGKFLGNLEKLE
ncbi:two component histidine kinase [Legionella quinlivanii]|uniref:Two component histidine kinase n=1 Tax=Legionella quinlivanii TaxID=45073 RepID=A0A0W0Y552_9GAMM|nr:LapD/MoxY N-terminal periplasmic domain-containing protein [Legionella quinlivanii]KTD51635.1 two component histidine kinase [Legionella quinlivanii]SEF61450.1 diguanylate cyclase/phosphodiesterase [Legionella quinlivanii DSM 21216]STY10838.1 two component histidine kinase, GGDEF domain protein/EAL domain protein [Legionella quinlivanii]